MGRARKYVSFLRFSWPFFVPSVACSKVRPTLNVSSVSDVRGVVETSPNGRVMSLD